MKISILIIFILIGSLTISAQNTFSKVFHYFGDTIFSQEAIRSAVVLDSNYYFLNSVYNDTVFSSKIIVKTDLNGNMLDYYSLGEGLYVYFANSMDIDVDSNIIIVGYKTLDKLGYVAKLTTQLDTLWTMDYEIPDSMLSPNCNIERTAYTSVLSMPDGYILTGYYTTNCNGVISNRRLFIHKISTNGATDWIKLYFNISPVYKLVMTPDSGYAFASSYNDALPYRVFKIDAQGVIQWNTIIDQDVFFSAPMGIDLLDANTTIIVSTFYNELDPYRHALKISSVNLNTHQINWTKDIYVDYSVYFMDTYLNVICSNSNIFIAGTANVRNYTYLDWDEKGYLLKLNNIGDSLWTQYYDNSYIRSQSDLNDFISLDDGSFLAFGVALGNNVSGGAWIAKIDSLGNTPGSYYVSIEEKYLVVKQLVSVFPNPAHNDLNISLDKIQNSEIHLSIYSSLGVLVKQELLEANQQQYQINIESLVSGAYFLKIESDANIVFSTKFIKQ